MFWLRLASVRFCCGKIRLNGAKKAHLINIDQVGFTSLSGAQDGFLLFIIWYTLLKLPERMPVIGNIAQLISHR